MFTRRTATVIISAPDASCARTITAGDEYLPVPTISRDENDLSAIVSRSTVPSANPESRIPSRAHPESRIPSSSPADKIDDFDLVTLADDGAGERVALQHDEIV